MSFRDFSQLPNVKAVKTIKDAVSLLTFVKNEMEDHFTYLEKCKRNKIISLVDKKDRIVLGIDEASVLYSGSRSSDDYELILKDSSLSISQSFKGCFYSPHISYPEGYKRP